MNVLQKNDKVTFEDLGDLVSVLTSKLYEVALMDNQIKRQEEAMRLSLQYGNLITKAYTVGFETCLERMKEGKK